jgi:hypothetical protein
VAKLISVMKESVGAWELGVEETASTWGDESNRRVKKDTCKIMYCTS